jgi:putative ABC transport system permease protein
MGGPWNITRGSIEALRGDDTVIIDELYAPMLGVHDIGDTVEIADHRARVVGFTRGIRSFTTIPYVFSSFKNAQNYTQLEQQQTMFLLIRTTPGANIHEVQQALQARLTGVDIYTNAEMLKRTQSYWVFSTGAGVSTLMGSVLGLIVGIVIVAQTIYSATIDHIREFGTLKAIGASNGKIYTVILTQAAISAVLGYIAAIAIAKFVSDSSQASNAPVLLPANVAIGTFFLALAMCASASVLSIRKATTIDPAMVFRG